MKTYEENIQELEALLEALNGDITLDEAVKKYETAQKMIAVCHAQLQQAETKIQKVTESISGLEVSRFESVNSSQQELMS